MILWLYVDWGVVKSGMIFSGGPNTLFGRIPKNTIRPIRSRSFENSLVVGFTPLLPIYRDLINVIVRWCGPNSRDEITDQGTEQQEQENSLAEYSLDIPPSSCHNR